MSADPRTVLFSLSMKAVAASIAALCLAVTALAQQPESPLPTPPPAQTEVLEEPVLTVPLPTIAADPRLLPNLMTVSIPPPLFALPPVVAPSVVTPRPAAVVVVRPKPPVRKPVISPVRVTDLAVHYGHSAQGRPLTAFVLENGSGVTSDTTLVFGGFHGNERTTPAVVGQLRLYLTQKPGLWPGRRVIVVPYANPDGWSAATRVNAHNVDLNRNFPAGWSCAGIAARNNPGPAPASEPETRAMIHLLKQYHPAKVVSLHSPLHCLNWTGPVGLAMAQAMSRYDHYRPTAHIGYPTPGSLGDYCGSLGIGIVTLELPQESESASWASNRDALLAAIRL